MNIKELRKQLSEYPDDMEVLVSVKKDGFKGVVTRVFNRVTAFDNHVVIQHRIEDIVSRS